MYVTYIPHFCQFPRNTHIIYIVDICTHLKGRLT
nr:MAG TPA: hypothetical protein [Caudoviricetes sp.]